MSEDEFIAPPSGTQYVAMIKPWRSTEATELLRAMDLARLHEHVNSDGTFKPGSFPRVRVTGTKVSQAPAPTQLPRNCYSEAYLQSLTEAELDMLDMRPPADLTISPELQKSV